MRERELRMQFFSRATFGEPAWEILLALYISEFSDRHLTIGKVADWIGAPLSTTQRWIAYLQRDGLIDKEGHPHDRRLSYVRLLDKGRSRLDNFFAAAAEQPLIASKEGAPTKRADHGCGAQPETPNA